MTKRSFISYIIWVKVFETIADSVAKTVFNSEKYEIIWEKNSEALLRQFMFKAHHYSTFIGRDLVLETKLYNFIPNICKQRMVARVEGPISCTKS